MSAPLQASFMANEYAVAIHDFLSEQIAAAQKNKAHAEKVDDPALAGYCDGRLQELYAIRQYMVDNIDLKTQKYY